MARPSRGGFAKREKERARFEKRQQKLARRQNKGEAGTDPGASPEGSEEAPLDASDPPVPGDEEESP